VSPGKGLFFELVNHGPGPVGYGFPFEVQRAEDGAWVDADVHPRGSAWPLPALSVPAGRTWQQALSLRDDVPPGRYRLNKSVSTEEGQVMLSFEFDIATSPPG
jgi:hypothetical protein